MTAPCIASTLNPIPSSNTISPEPVGSQAKYAASASPGSGLSSSSSYTFFLQLHVLSAVTGNDTCLYNVTIGRGFKALHQIVSKATGSCGSRLLTAFGTYVGKMWSGL